MSGINTIESLRRHLQAAMELEHATIPVYLTALFSIREGANELPARIIRSVVMEEMLHMTLVGNVLNAVGGSPVIACEKFIPNYPCPLPFSNGALQVGLLKFSPQALQMFLRIEKPEEKNTVPKAEQFSTIGQFYDGLICALKQLEASAVKQRKTIFTGDPDKQIQTEHFYYGGEGRVIPVTDLESAVSALEEVIEQGEGHDHTIYEADNRGFSDQHELAHYYRFNELKEGRLYAEGDTPSNPPSGAQLAIDWESVWNVIPNPKMARFEHRPDVYALMQQFNRQYMHLLAELESAFNARPDRMIGSVPIMYELKELATGLMKIPGDSGSYTVGPSWEYLLD